MTIPGQDPANPGDQASPNPPAPAPAPTPEPDKGPDGEPFDAARAQRLIDQLRAEVKELKPKAQAGQQAQQRLQEIEDASKTELEKAQARVKELEQQAARSEEGRREALIRAAVEREAHAQGAVKAETVYRLLDRSAIEIAEDGTVKGADKAVKALLEAEPYLKGSATGGVAGPNPTPRQNGHPPSREDQVKQAQDQLAASGRFRI